MLFIVMWRGVIIKESLQDKSLLDEVKVVGTRETDLESERERGVFHFMNVEVEDNKINNVLEKLRKSLKPSWYAHLVKGNVMHVAFSRQILTATRDNQEEFGTIRKFAISRGIHPDQLPLEHLLDHPFD